MDKLLNLLSMILLNKIDTRHVKVLEQFDHRFIFWNEQK